MKISIFFMISFFTVYSLNIFASNMFCDDGNCDVRLAHQHENNWIRILGEEDVSVLLREQVVKYSNYSNLVINIYDILGDVDFLVLRDERLEDILSCFVGDKNITSSRERCVEIAQALKANFPHVQYVDFGLYHPRDKKKFITELSFILPESGELGELRQAFADNFILIAQSSDCDRCLDSPRNEKNLTIRIGSSKIAETNYILRSLPFGVPLGFLVLGGLALKDYVGWVLIEGGPEIEALSLLGLILPVGGVVVITGVFAHCAKIDFIERIQQSL